MDECEAVQIANLVQEYPLAWVVSTYEGEFHATPLPVLPVTSNDGKLVALRGHIAASNPHLQVLEKQPQALFLFMGPQSYISPSWLTDRTQAPTWYYTGAQCVAKIRLIEDPAGMETILRDTAAALEAGRPDAWRLEEMGPRYALLAPAIVGFEAQILNGRARFKLGRTERREVYAEVRAKLTSLGATRLVAWIDRVARLNADCS